jgi:hypothetical protein
MQEGITNQPIREPESRNGRRALARMPVYRDTVTVAFKIADLRLQKWTLQQVSGCAANDT